MSELFGVGLAASTGVTAVASTGPARVIAPRCVGPHRGGVCSKLLAVYVTPPSKIVCPRCGSTNEML